ncbi:MAG: hypothetical protein K2J07_02145, partial [Muribaculaceae bacterium]|nr:hypothetical protein [Muribaculaceae bacterium]
VKVARTDLPKKQLDFVIADVNKNRPGTDDLGSTDSVKHILAGQRPGKKRRQPRNTARRPRR